MKNQCGFAYSYFRVDIRQINYMCSDTLSFYILWRIESQRFVHFVILSMLFTHWKTLYCYLWLTLTLQYCFCYCFTGSLIVRCK